MHLILSRKVELVKVPWFRQNDYGPIVNYWQPNFLPIPSQFTLFVLMHFYASLHLSRTIKISKTRTWSYLELTVWCMQKKLFLPQTIRAKSYHLESKLYFLRVSPADFMLAWPFKNICTILYISLVYSCFIDYGSMHDAFFQVLLGLMYD